MYYSEYKEYIEKYKQEPTPLFEYPLYKELKSGLIGDSGIIREKFPKFTTYYADRIYENKTVRKDNPWKNGERFISVSEKVGVRKYKLVEGKEIKTPIYTLNKKKVKKVAQYSKSGQLLKIWDSYKQASQDLDINVGSISNVLNGHAVTAGGYKFKYLT